MPIQFIFIDTRIALQDRKKLKLFVEAMFRKNKRELVTLLLVFCTDDFLLDINRRFLQHNFYTDIVTFNLSDDPNIIEGEIYISADRIRENSATHNASLKEELHRVIFHGVLHLCGYKDKSKEEKKQMTGAEDKNLAVYFK
jgi:rRNA maturation RNase YbeY